MTIIAPFRGASAEQALFRYDASDHPAGSQFSSGGDRAEIVTVTPTVVAPRWHLVDNAVGSVVCVGDSIGYGYGSIESFFNIAVRTAAGSKALNFCNLAVNSGRLKWAGSAAFDCTALSASFVVPAITGKPMFVIVEGGSNDIFLDGKSAAQCWIDEKAICAAIKATHPQCWTIVGTLIPRQNNGTFQAEADDLRLSQIALSVEVDYCANPASDPEFDTPADSLSVVNYLDQIHPTYVGHTKIAPYYAAKLALALAAAGL